MRENRVVFPLHVHRLHTARPDGVDAQVGEILFGGPESIAENFTVGYTP